MKKIILCLCFLIGCVKTPQKISQPENFTDAATWDAHYDKPTELLTVDVKLKEGFHAYAAGEKIGRPVTFSISPLSDWKLVGPVNAPAGKVKKLGSQDSVVLENAFSLTGKVVGGKKVIYGELQLQVCTDRQCDQPRIHAFMVKVPKKK